MIIIKSIIKRIQDASIIQNLNNKLHFIFLRSLKNINNLRKEKYVHNDYERQSYVL